MDDHRETGGPTSGFPYVLRVRRLGTGAEVILCDAARHAAGRSEDVWRHRFETFEAANTLFLAMLPYPSRWLPWTRMISILGADFIHGLIAAEATMAKQAEERRTRERRRLEESKRRRNEAARRTWMWLVLRGEGPRVVASRGDHRVVIMELETIDEALRVWDWMRWQRRSIDEWLAIFDLEGSEALQAVILRRMVFAERRHKAAGGSRRAGRPLRDWRPGSDGTEAPR